MNSLIVLGALCLGVAFGDPEVVKHDLADDNGDYQIQSPNYPEDAPANLDKTWVITAPEGKTIDLACDDIRLFEETPCGPWVLKIKDGDETKEICTSVFDYTLKSKTNKLEIQLKIGDADRGFLSCLASLNLLAKDE